MDYEMRVTIRRSDPTVLAEDFRAVTDFLAQRKLERTALTSSQNVVKAAERILKSKGETPTNS
jgi:hypothetical protein